MSRNRRQFALRLRIPALILCTTLSITQAAPAWALRPEVSSPAATVGLEEAFGRDSGNASAPLSPNPFQAALLMARRTLQHLLPRPNSQPSPTEPGNLPSSEMVVAVGQGLRALPASTSLADKALAALKMLQTFRQSETRPGWNEEAIRDQIEQVVAHAPKDCPTCAAYGLVSIASEPAFRQIDPSLEFRDAENLTALMIALDVWVTGKVQFVQEDTHRVFANTLQTVQATYQAADLGVDDDARREWMAVSLTLDELRTSVSRAPGFVLAHLGGNHYARILGAGEAAVSYEQVMAEAGGGYQVRQLSVPWSEFASRWMGAGRQGYALIAVPRGEHSIPGRTLRPRESQRIIGCCGVSNASGVEWLFSRSDASRRIVQVLESRGFDNYANARKFSMTLPYGFFSDARYAQARTRLQARVTEAETSGRGDIVIVPPYAPPAGASEHERTRAEQGVVRFFGISRGVGSSTANLEQIHRDISTQVHAVAETVFGPDIEVRQGSYEGHWHILVRGINRLVTVMEESAMDHTRYKTKGGDRAENAHHWPWKGISGGMNGDWETYEYFKEVLIADFNEVFEGTTDSEVLFHMIGDLAEIKDPSARATGHVPLEVAIIRTFRLIENIEALVRASEVLQEAYATNEITQAEQQQILAKLVELGIDVEQLKRTEQVSLGQGRSGRKQIPLLVRRMIRAAIQNPALYDQEATASNGWQGYYRMLGAQLPQTRDRRFDNHKMLNISINVASLHDNHNAVVARTYDKSTSFSFGFGRNERGELVQVLGGSEVRGFAPLIGVPELSVPIREGIVDLVNGKIEQRKAGPWSVYTVDGVTLTRHGVWDGAVEALPQGETLRVKWTQVQPGKDEEHREWTAFRLETQAQPITLKLTLDALTSVEASGARLIRLREAFHREGALAEKLRAALANPDTLIYAGASGTSFHALSLVGQQQHLFTRVDTSDKWNSILPEGAIRWEVAQGRPPIFVVVSQSGETGAARTLAKRVADLGGLVIVVTNRPGSSLYVEAQQFGYGIIVTESIDETAVAATGSNSSQALALRVLGMLREELSAPAQARREVQRHNSQQLDNVLTLTTYLQPNGQVHQGRLEVVLDSFNPGHPNARVVDQIVRFIKAPHAGLEESFAEKTAFRHTNFIFTSVDPVGFTIAMEHALKVMEVTRRMAAAIPLPQVLAYGIGDGDPRQRHVPPWDARAAMETVQANLQRYTTGLPSQVGRYPHFTAFPRGQDGVLAKATEIVLLGDGEDLTVLDYLATRYQPTTLPIPIRDAHYHGAPPHVRKGALVVAIQPWAREHVELLESYRDQGATVVVAGSLQRPLAQEAQSLAERHGAFVPIEGADRLFGETVVLDLFMLRVLEAVCSAMDKQLAESVQGVVERGVEQLREQVSGMQTVIESFSETPAGAPPHRNLVALERIKAWTTARGWQHFDWWTTGKGLTVPAARDLQLLASGATGKLMESAETSEFKHGRYGATNYGDMYINFWPEQGTPDWADNKKTSIDEVVPRVAQYPYPLYQNLEPGMIVLVGRDNPNDPDLQHLSDVEYRELRALRRRAEDVDAIKRADAVFITPHGGFLELLSLNRILIESLAKAMFEDLKAQGLTWNQAAPRTVVFNVDTGIPIEGKEGLYRAMGEAFGTERRSQIVTVAPEATGMPAVFSNQVIPVDSKDPIAFLVVGHQLTTSLVNARFQGVLEYLVSLAAALRRDLDQGPNGIVGKVTPLFRTPSELMMEYAKGNVDAVRAVKAFAVMGPPEFRDVEARLVDILDWYNIDPIKAIGAAGSMPELRHAVVDLIEKLAKVVVNFSAIMVGGPARAPVPLCSLTLDGTSFFLEQAGLDYLQATPEALGEIREVVQTALGPRAAAGNPNEVLSAFITLAQRRLPEACLKLRDQYPDLPPTMPVTLHLYGSRLAHQRDGRLFLNVHALRHPLLAFQQLEHEGVHELIGPAVASLSLPASLRTTDVPDEQVRDVLGEVTAVANEITRFLSYRSQGQHGVLEVLQGPNVVDATGVFQQLLERVLQLSPQEPLTPHIMAALKDSRPDRIAAIEFLQQAYQQAPAAIDGLLEILHQALRATQRFARLDVDAAGNLTALEAMLAPQVPEGFLQQRRLDILQRVGTHGLATFEQMDARVRRGEGPQVQVYPDQRDPNHAVILIVALDREGLLGAIGSTAADKRVNIEDDFNGSNLALPKTSLFVMGVHQTVQALEAAGVSGAVHGALKKLAEGEQEAVEPGLARVRAVLGDLEKSEPRLWAQIKQIYKKFGATRRSQWDIFAEHDDLDRPTGKTSIVLAMWNHTRIANQIIDPTANFDRDIEEVRKLEIPELIPGRPVAVGAYRVQALLDEPIITTIKNGLTLIAKQEQQEWEAGVEQATAALQTAYAEYQQLYSALQQSGSPLFQQVPTLADVETTLLTRGVKEHQLEGVRNTLLAMLGGPSLPIKDTPGSEGDTVRALRGVLTQAAEALGPVIPSNLQTPAPFPPSSVHLGGLEEVTAPRIIVSQSGPTDAVGATRAVTAATAGTIAPLMGTVTIPQTAGVIYGRTEGLAVGIAVRLTQGDQAVPSRFLVRNEAEETVVRQALPELSETAIVRVWQHRSFEEAVTAARQQLTGAGVQIIHEITQLPVGANQADDFLRGIQRLIGALNVQGLDAQTAAVAAQRAYDLFV